MTLLTCFDCGPEFGAANSEACSPCKEAFGKARWAERNGGVGMLKRVLRGN